jgi:hypothetical protein
MVKATPRPLYSPEGEAVPIAQEVKRTAEHVWTRAENLVPSGIIYPTRPATSFGITHAKVRRIIMVPLLTSVQVCSHSSFVSPSV